MDAELLGLALQGARALMLTSARYFEEKGAYDSAVILYQKVGWNNRVDNMFRTCSKMSSDRARSVRCR
jgi:hypothetical protein